MVHPSLRTQMSVIQTLRAREEERLRAEGITPNVLITTAAVVGSPVVPSLLALLPDTPSAAARGPEGEGSPRKRGHKRDKKKHKKSKHHRHRHKSSLSSKKR